MKKKFFLLIALAILNLLSIQAVTTRYVTTTGSDSNDGASWANAKLTFTSALTASASGDVIYVAKGTYQVSSTVIMVSGVNVYGGYDDATGLRDIVNNKTIVQNTASDTRVLNGGNLAVETIWYGFTITGGSRTTAGAGAQIGTNSTLSNCIITGNNNTGTTGSTGGGVNFTGSGKLLNCIIENNTSTGVGAGISCLGGDGIIENCIIRNNKATGTTSVGGVVMRGNSVMKNCIVANNEATAGSNGGINAYGNSKVINCTVVNNKAATSFGATYLGGTASIINSILWNNSSATNVFGADATVTMTTCAVQSSASAGSFLLNASNTASDGPNFVSPSTTIGYTTDNLGLASWRLQYNSPCVDAGTDATSFGITTDIKGVSRPYDRGFDIGAYEYNGTTSVPSVRGAETLSLYPNPMKDIVTINVANISSISAFDVTGKEVSIKYMDSKVDVSNLSKGIYLFIISADNKTYFARGIK